MILASRCPYSTIFQSASGQGILGLQRSVPPLVLRLLLLDSAINSLPHDRVVTFERLVERRQRACEAAIQATKRRRCHKTQCPGLLTQRDVIQLIYLITQGRL